jgi:hypothetical protein
MSVNASNSLNACGTCGDTTTPGTEFAQNNVAKTILFTYISDERSMRIPSRADVAGRLNARGFTVSEIQSPVIVRITDLISYDPTQVATASATHIFLFLKGKGIYGLGAGATEVDSTDIFYLNTQETSTEDIVNSGNTEIIDLYTLEDGDYITAANSEERNLSNPNIIYFFQYFKDGESYLVRVIDAVGLYGGSYEDQLTAANLLPSVSSEDGGGQDYALRSDLNGLTLESNQAAQEIYLKGANGTIMATINVGFLNNEGTTFYYNSVTNNLELKNDAGAVLSVIPVSAFVGNMVRSAAFSNGNTLEFKDSSNVVLFSVPITIANVSGLQSALDAKLTGTRATDLETQITASVVEDNKFVTRLKLFNWWATIKAAATSIPGIWNFTAGLRKNGLDVATVNDVAGKLNSGSNMSLSGLSIRLPRVSPDGTISADEFLSWIAINRELIIGSGTASGRLSILSQIFEFAVQDNIASGNANILFNAGQEDALSFKDKNGKVYMTFRSTVDGIGMIFKQREVFDEGVFYPNSRRQAALTTAGAGVKVYAKSAQDAIVSIQMPTDTMTAIIDATFTLKNSTASQFIVARFRASAKRVSGTITISQGALEILSNLTNPAYQTWAAGVEAVNNNSLQFFFTPAAGDSNTYTGVYSEIKYTLN